MLESENLHVPHAQPTADECLKNNHAPLATIVIVPRERFGEAVRSLASVIEHNAGEANVVYIDAGSPLPVAKKLRSLCVANGFSYIRFDRPVSPNKARNIGARQSETRYVAFIDNDVIVSHGWLEQMIVCAEETGADVVAPLTCQKEPLHSEIHQAGGEFAVDHVAFLKALPEERRITDVHLLQGQKVADVRLKRGEAQCCEFHCALVRTAALRRVGGLDERLLATKEHIDFCMTIWATGGIVMFEPRSIVTYLFPGRRSPLQLSDWRFFALRWSPRWQRQSLEHFQKKWGLHKDPYFEKRRAMLDWRLKEAIAKPLVSRAPLLGRSYRVKQYAIHAVTAILIFWSEWLVLMSYAKRSAGSEQDLNFSEL